MIGPVQYAANMPIYLPQPVNRRHPLNRGLVAWWKVLPAWNSGNKWIDLMGLSPGTLANMGTGSGWGGSPAPGGLAGSMRFDGVNYTQVQFPGIAMGTTCSAFVWMNALSGTDGDGSIIVDSTGSVGLLWYNPTHRLDVYYSGRHLGSIDLGIGQWHRVGFTAVAGLVTYYVDGKPDGTTYSGFPGFTAARIGSDLPGGDRLLGNMDSIKLYPSRALSPSEVAWEYLDERAGCLNTLNRYSFNFPSPPGILGTVSYPYLGVVSRS